MNHMRLSPVLYKWILLRFYKWRGAAPVSPICGQRLIPAAPGVLPHNHVSFAGLQFHRNFRKHAGLHIIPDRAGQRYGVLSRRTQVSAPQSPIGTSLKFPCATANQSCLHSFRLNSAFIRIFSRMPNPLRSTQIPSKRTMQLRKNALLTVAEFFILSIPLCSPAFSVSFQPESQICHISHCAEAIINITLII